MIQINVNGSVVSVQETEALYCGAQNTYTCSFVFDRSWDSFLKSAVFRVNGRAITAVIDDNNSCILPWELLVRDNIGSNIEVGVYGVSAESEILTSVWDSIGAVREGSEIGSDAREPSAGVYEQVMASIRRVDDKIASYSTDIQTLAQRAESAAAAAFNSAETAVESKSVASAAADKASGAKDAVLNALNNVPAGSTVIVNDLTAGGTSAALSAEMGKVLGRRPNPNLLHNWYFGNPVNQRGGYIVQPNTPWYTDLSFSTVGGYTDGYYKYTPCNTACGSVQIGNQVGFVAADHMKRGYDLHDNYGIDRWKGFKAVLTVKNGSCIELRSRTSDGVYGMYQMLERYDELKGKIGTFSAIINGTLYSRPVTIGDGNWISLGDNMYVISTDWAHIYIRNLTVDSVMEITAMKLELGDTQTLAHQNADGSWVLNEIPDYSEELAKCQRYQLVIPRLRIKYDNSANIADVILPLVFPTTMRVAPAITHDSVNGISIGTDYDKTHALLQIDPSTSVDATIENIIFDANL